jgi:methyltransferase (TIGR00027 family)
MGRAPAHGSGADARFSDPTAMALLPDDARAEVERFRDGPKPKGLEAGFRYGSLEHRSRLMVARTVAVDDAVRAAAAPQLVILGAGLDGRAWRMPELADAVVFEVDHPDSQRDKRARAGALAQAAREVRFVPVDFQRDELEGALAAAGHDPARSTTWIWEGVVMYLTLADIEASMRVIARRSAPGSTLVIVYHQPAAMLKLVGWLVRRLGEPLRSSFTPPQMRALLARHGFDVATDENVAETAARLSPDLARKMRLVRHMRTVVATRTATASS